MNMLVLIFFMMVVTYLPRVIPSIICDKLKFGKRFKKSPKKTNNVSIR